MTTTELTQRVKAAALDPGFAAVGIASAERAAEGQRLREWLARDPIPAYRKVLRSRGVSEETLDAIDASARGKVDQATEEAKAGAEPDLALASTNVWSDGGAAWRNS